MEREIVEVTRKSNFELFRVLAMCLIILIHFASAVDLSALGLTGNKGRILGGALVGICNMGPTCFCLISGYFGIKFSLKKLLKYEFFMVIYSCIETIILIQVFPGELQGIALLEQIVKSFLPFVSRKYWFYSCYICIFLFSGYIQKFIDALKKEELEKFIGLALLVFSILPTVFYFEIMQDAGKGLIHMALMYIIGRYIRLYQNELSNKRKNIVIFFALWGLNTISILYPVKLGSITHSLCRDNSITNIVMAVIFLHFFKDIEFTSKGINKLTKVMFAAFALENSMVNVFAEFLGQSNLRIDNFLLGLCLIIASAWLILAICLLIGQIVEIILGKAEDKMANAFIYVASKVKRIFGSD